MNERPNFEATEAADKKSALDAFAQSSVSEKTDLVATAFQPMSVDRVFGAQKVAVYRDESKVLERLKLLAAAAGSDWYYRWQVNGDGGKKEWIEGPSIKLADDLARIYGNCDLDTRIIDAGDSWLFYSRFIDLETGYSRTRPFQQRKGQSTSKKMDGGRARDIAFQIGASKAERNVVVHALRTFADFAFEEAKNALIGKIGADLPAWRDRVLNGLQNQGIDKLRVEKVMGRTATEWLAPDVAKIIASMKAIADGMASWEESFPPLDAKPEDEAAPVNGLDKFASNNAQPASQQPASEASPPAGAGQPAPGTQTAESNAPQSEQPSPGAGTATADPKSDKSGAKTDQPAGDPTDEKTWAAYADTFIAQLGSAEEGTNWWKAGKQLRNKCNVTEEVREERKQKLDEKIASFGKPAKK
jgi:hypothetical protein